MGIIDFRAITIKAAGLYKEGSGYFAGGQFVVRVTLDPADCARYEYRQYIQGTALLTPGKFTGAATRANWSATGTSRDAGPDFAIPGGLKSYLKEDGEKEHGKTLHFGYRTSTALLAKGKEDRYLPDQSSGFNYRARDTWGLRAKSAPSGLLVEIDLIYRGVVIDRNDGDKVVKMIHWKVSVDDIIV